MTDLTLNEIIQRIKEKKPEFSEIGIDKIGVFGSFSRNEQTINSDIDIAISFLPGKKNFDNFMETKFLLEELFPERKIDLVLIEGIKKQLHNNILQDFKNAS